MGTKTLAEVEALARKILTTYFCDSDMEFMISTFADDVIWLGGGELQKAEGKEAVAAAFRRGRDDMIACDMSEEVYHSMDLGGGCYLCEGVSRLQSRLESRTLLNVRQRVTFILREKGDGLETVHIHNSIPYANLRDDELFPMEAGRAEFEKLRKALHEKNREFDRQAQFLEQLYNTVPCGIIQFSTDAAHELISSNPMVWKFYGYDSQESFEKGIRSPLQTVEARDYGWIVSMIDRLELNGQPESYHRHCKKKNGEDAWINVVMGRIVNSDGREVIQTVFTDITEQTKLEKAQSQERLLENRSLRAAICTAYPLIISVNLTKDTYRCFVNEQDVYKFPPEGRYTDLARASAAGICESFRAEFAAAFDRRELMRRFAGGQREIYMEAQTRSADGACHWVAMHVICIENPIDGDVLAIDLVKLLDAQRQEQARQEQLLRDALASAQAASRAKSDFLSRMSHDIRTPMNAIIGMSAIGQLKSEDPKAVGDCFRKIDASSRFLLSLINNILDMSKIETERMEIAREPFDFKSFVEDINQIIYPQTLEKEISYEMRHREPLESRYIGDSLRTKQILMNLLSNALKFTPAGGRIYVDIKEQQRLNGHAHLQFVVSDTGAGMSEAFMERMFQPFEQEDPGNARNNIGSGLGLSIVYNLVQLMGGDIGVKSRKGEGSKFTVTIPFQLVSDDTEREWEQKRQNLLKGLRVLVVDDDPAVGHQAALILEEIGAETVFVDSGFKAVEEVEARLRENRRFDVAMIDWKMPVIDGIDTAKWLRRLVGGDPMLIMISACDWSNIEGAAREAGIDRFIAKPLFRSVIYDAFSGLGQKTPKRPPREEHTRQSALEGRRILLVEDNELNQEIAKTLLEMYGASVDVAGNGQIALERFETSAPGTYHAVLMDMRMPVMDGLEATRRIRALKRADAGTVHILAMTANAFEEDKRVAHDAGMTGYFVKPLDVDVMVGELEKIL